jgi:hypothetical protein
MPNKPLKADTQMSNTAGNDNDDDGSKDDTDCTNCIWTRLETVIDIITVVLINFAHVFIRLVSLYIYSQ